VVSYLLFISEEEKYNTHNKMKLNQGLEIRNIYANFKVENNITEP